VVLIRLNTINLLQSKSFYMLCDCDHSFLYSSSRAILKLLIVNAYGLHQRHTVEEWN